MPIGSTRLPILTAVIAVAAIIAARLPTIQSEARANELPAARLPLRLGQWEGIEVPVPQDVQRALPTAHILSRQYQCPSGLANVTIVTGSDATALHDPHDCLTGDGWHFLKEQSRTVDVGAPAHPIQVREVLMANGPVRARMWYWYAIGSEIYNRTLPARLGLFRIRLTEGRGRRAQFVRLIVGGETESARTTVMLADLTRQIARSS
jgi:EpsI family protein